MTAERDPDVLEKALKAFRKGPLTHARLNAALGGKYLNVTGVTQRLRVQGYIRELDRVPNGGRGARTIRFEITELGRRHLDPHTSQATPWATGMSEEVYQLKRTTLITLTDELARETYRRFLLKKPQYSDLPFEKLTPVDAVLCESDDCPYPNCHGYPGGPAAYRRCVFCESTPPNEE